MAWNRSNTDANGNAYLINRFPICAMWYYTVAKYIGYDEDQAKSMGLARATFFARAKTAGNSHAKKSPGKAGDAKFDHNQKQPDIEMLNFAGIGVYVDREDGMAIFGNEKVTAGMFQKGVIDKLNNKRPMFFEKLSEKMMELASKHSKAEMNSGVAYTIYESIRDKFRTEEVLA